LPFLSMVSATAPVTSRKTRSRRAIDWRLIGTALAIAAVTRVILFAAVWISMRALPRLGFYPAQLPDSFLPEHASLDGWVRWDAAHYIAVAQIGYGEGNPSPGEGLGFFPVFPLLMRALVALPGVPNQTASYAIAALIIANVCFFMAVALLALLAASQSRGHALTAVLIFCLSPFAFFFNAAYSESLFLAMVLASLVLAQRQHWLSAAAIAGFATATRLAGLALVPALVFGAYRAGVRGWRLVTTGLLAASGFFVWTLYTTVRHDDPRAYFVAQENWGGWDEHVRFYAELFLHSPDQALGGDPGHLIIIINVLLAFASLLLLPLVWRQTAPQIALFTVLIVVGHVAVTWVSLGRYLLPAIGIYLVLGNLLDRSSWSGWPRDLFLAGSTMLLTLLAVLFAHGFWVV
jgi:hypothetical protein